MTCIVGIVDDEFTYIGGERGVSDNETILSMSTPKVYSRDGWVYGYAGTIGIGQLLNLIPLTSAIDDIFVYIRLYIVEELKKAIESYSNSPAEHDTSWLIGREGRLFELHSSDWSVIEVKESAIGGGSQIAFGSLYTSSIYIEDNTPIDRLGMSLGAAITYSPSCQGPIDILFA